MLNKLQSKQDLETLREDLLKKRHPDRSRVTICSGTGCHAYGCTRVSDVFKAEVEKQRLGDKVDIKTTGCHGFCEKGPIIIIQPGDIFYQRVVPEDVPEILSETVIKGKIIDRLLYTDPTTGKRIVHQNEVPFYQKQERFIFGSNGEIDPTNIEDYIAIGGYKALAKVLLEMSQEQVIDEVKHSGLRGRGGGGFPTGVKWESCRRAPGDIKYVIVNADEGDPGAYANRSLLEGNPHSVLEGLIIGAYAIGCHEGYIYVRHEYPLAVEAIGIAINQAQQLGLLGDNILGSDFNFLAIKSILSRSSLQLKNLLISILSSKLGIILPNLV